MHLNEYIESKIKLEEELKEHGIDSTNLEDVLSKTERYRNIHSYIAEARQRQFNDDAYDALIDFKSYTHKNQEKVALYLRTFAEHVARETQEILFAIKNVDQDTLSTADIVDRIPSMSTTTEEK